MPSTYTRSRPTAHRDPHDSAVDTREWRSRSEQMVVRPLGSGRYEVTGTSGHHYLVSIPSTWCTCPDHLIRRVRCKHLRRVANELATGSIPAPDTVVTLCAACDTETAVPSDMVPPLCSACEFAPGDVAIDRETGTAVIVVEVLADRAADVPIPEALTTVARYPANRAYPATDPVVLVVYPSSLPAVTQEHTTAKRYAFPLSRLRHFERTINTENTGLIDNSVGMQPSA